MNKEDFFDQYEELAMKILDDPRPNTFINIPLTNPEIADEVCDLLQVDGFDLFEEIDPKTVYEGEDTNEVLATAYIYLLRWLLFTSAQRGGIGSQAFNTRAIADSEQWYVRLKDRFKALESGEPTKHVWLH